MNSLKHKNHCVFNLCAHLVFVTKYRRKILTKEILHFLNLTFQDIGKKYNFSLLEMNGESDYIHLLIFYTPSSSISDIVKKLKGISSFLIKKNFFFCKLFYYKGQFWSSSYFATSCGGAPLSIIKQYIRNQKI